MGALPDPSWPVAQQLDHAVTTIKRNVKLILDTKAEMEHYKKVALVNPYLYNTNNKIIIDVYSPLAHIHQKYMCIDINVL